MKFIVDIDPIGKARPRLGFGGHVYTPKKTTDAEREIRDAFYEVRGRRLPVNTPVLLEVCAYFPIPQSWSKKKQAAAMRGEILPTKKPDADNILKLVADALNGAAYVDDAQIIRASVWKEYSKNGIGYLAIDVGGID